MPNGARYDIILGVEYPNNQISEGNMKYSDIKVGSIYNVDFEPVRECEFGRLHLALVLKKNNDKKTAIVMPLTSASNGENINKKNIGRIETLPSSLKVNDTYAVYNQIRTVNASRFIRLKDFDEEGNNRPIDCPLNEIVFKELLMLALEELTFSFDEDEKMDIYLSLYYLAKLRKSISLAYQIKKSTEDTEEIYEELGKLLASFDGIFQQEKLPQEVQEIFKKAKRKVDKNPKNE